VLLVATHSLWFRHFTVNYYPFGEIVTYFLLFVWLVPFVFFISLSANEHTLPTTAGGGWRSASTTNDGDFGPTNKSSSVIKAFLNKFQSAASYISGSKSL
jgi:hypothetical protein